MLPTEVDSKYYHYECGGIRFSYPKFFNKNVTHTNRVLSTLFDKFLEERCDPNRYDIYDSYANLSPNYGRMLDSKYEYQQKLLEIGAISDKQFQKDCEKLKPQICDSTLRQIFKELPDNKSFLKNLCRDFKKV